MKGPTSGHFFKSNQINQHKTSINHDNQKERNCNRNRYRQSRRKLQNHICPMPFDEVNRLIEFYSNQGEVIADPFGGIGTTGVCALKKGRKAIITELNDLYAKTAVMYMKETEVKNSLPTLFDVITKEKAA